MRGSEMPGAQPLSKLVAIARAASRRIQHPALNVIGILRGFNTFGESTGSFTGAADRQQDQNDGEGNCPVAQASSRHGTGGDPDALTSITAIAALLAGRFFGWIWMDAAGALLGAAVIAIWAWGIPHAPGATVCREGKAHGLSLL